jgi:hypothetical protein
MNKLWISALVFAMFACQQAPSEESTDTESVTEEVIEVEASEHHDMDHSAMEGTSMDADSEFLAVAEGAKVFFVNLTDGQVVPNKVKVVMGIEGMEVKPAGELVIGTGHHHILIDGEPLAKGTLVPKDDMHIHFGNGDTEAEINVPSGEHTLTLQFANGAHFSYGEQMSATITVTAP